MVVVNHNLIEKSCKFIDKLTTGHKHTCSSQLLRLTDSQSHVRRLLDTYTVGGPKVGIEISTEHY